MNGVYTKRLTVVRWPGSLRGANQACLDLLATFCIKAKGGKNEIITNDLFSETISRQKPFL